MSKQKLSLPSLPIKLFGYIRSLETEHHLIPKKRKQELLGLAAFISQKIAANEVPEIIVICTHNSRRSHFGQLWLKMAAIYYGIPQLRAFSGGTEATAFHPNAVGALRYVGFNIEKTDESENSFYECEIGNGGQVLVMFSKKYDDERNPQSGFAALLVCSDADEACPMVTGAEARFAVPYEDPKKSDDTDDMADTYLDCCRQIAREMFFVVWQAVGKDVI